MTADQREESQGAPPELRESERELVEALRKHLPAGTAEPAALATILVRFLHIEVRQLTRSFQGPIPPPGMLAEYDERFPGLANQIVERADREQEHRHETTRYRLETERQALQLGAATTSRAQCLAFVIAMTIIIGGFICILKGYPLFGLSAVILAIASLVGSFMYGAKVRREEAGENEGDNPNASAE